MADTPEFLDGEVALKSAPIWIPVGFHMRPPAEDHGRSVPVLLTTKSTGILTGHCQLRESWMDDDDAEGLPAWVANYPVGAMSAEGDVTHWMPLPEAPKQ